MANLGERFTEGGVVEMIPDTTSCQQTTKAELQSMIGSLHSDNHISEAAEAKCSGL